MATVYSITCFQKEHIHCACKTDPYHVRVSWGLSVRIQARFPPETITSYGVIAF